MAGTRYCRLCGKQVATKKKYEVNHLIHLILTLVTCGLWAPFWIVACILSVFQGEVCAFCGTRT